jgi:transcriptional regulator with XRE-family HTH domain
MLESSVREKLGKNIKKMRIKKSMSQGDICRAINMDRGYMSAIENGKKNITIQQLEKLAGALDVSVDKLLK